VGKSKISILREAILSDLTDQLDRNGTTGQYYSDLVKDYMKLWDTKNRLILDIELRGNSGKRHLRGDQPEKERFCGPAYQA